MAVTLPIAPELPTQPPVEPVWPGGTTMGRFEHQPLVVPQEVAPMRAPTASEILNSQTMGTDIPGVDEDETQLLSPKHPAFDFYTDKPHPAEEIREDTPGLETGLSGGAQQFFGAKPHADWASPEAMARRQAFDAAEHARVKSYEGQGWTTKDAPDGRKLWVHEDGRIAPRSGVAYDGETDLPAASIWGDDPEFSYAFENMKMNIEGWRMSENIEDRRGRAATVVETAKAFGAGILGGLDITVDQIASLFNTSTAEELVEDIGQADAEFWKDAPESDTALTPSANAEANLEAIKEKGRLVQHNETLPKMEVTPEPAPKTQSQRDKERRELLARIPRG
jgi:hypothetical protein